MRIANMSKTPLNCSNHVVMDGDYNTPQQQEGFETYSTNCSLLSALYLVCAHCVDAHPETHKVYSFIGDYDGQSTITQNG